MGWLSSLWNRVCSTVKRVYNWMKDTWNYVTNDVENHKDKLQYKSQASQEYYTLTRYEYHLQEKKRALQNRMDIDEWQDMDGLLGRVRMWRQ